MTEGTATVRLLAVGDTNQAPVARRDVARTNPGAQVCVFVTGNDSDPDGDSFGVVGVDTPAHGSAYFGSSYMYYTPAVGFAGVETMTYTLRDSHGLSSRGQVVVWVDTATGPGAPETERDYLVATLGASVSFDDAFLLRNDTDPAGQVLSVQAVSGGSLKGTVVETSPGDPLRRVVQRGLCQHRRQPAVPDP